MSILLACIDSKHLSEQLRVQLEALAGSRELVITMDPARIKILRDQVEVAVGEVPFELLGDFPNLVWLQQMGTGANWLMDHPEAREHPFILTNCSDAYCVVLAEHIFAMMLSFARKLPDAFRSQQQSSWEEGEAFEEAHFELRGKQLLLAGVGSIGKEVALRARAFQMKVSGLRRNADQPVEGIEKIFSFQDRQEAYKGADLVVNSLPLTNQTRGFFDREAFRAMRPAAFFFNIGRGGTVDEEALIEALQSGEISGVGLDVFEQEPLPSDCPLWSMPNVIITPHSGGCHKGRYESWLEVVVDNLKRFNEGRALRNVVNKQLGY